MEKTIKQPAFSPRKCIACWKCVNACPRNAISKVGILWHRHAKISYSDCIGCNICVRTCPRGCFSD